MFQPGDICFDNGIIGLTEHGEKKAREFFRCLPGGKLLLRGRDGKPVEIVTEDEMVAQINGDIITAIKRAAKTVYRAADRRMADLDSALVRGER
jgi:hypothetical protein